MLNNRPNKVKQPLTYISLFSSAGVGCYAFKQEAFECIATVELLARRIQVQKINRKCRYQSGYICGDIQEEATKQDIFREIALWKRYEHVNGVDVVVATPPCQGISYINHKKKADEIKRNSLVIESVELVDKIQPKYFIFENVLAFEKTLCITKEERVLPIGSFIREVLGNNYIITGRILNFMNYGSNSSRTRTLIIGVNKKFRDSIAPYELFPDYQQEKTLREVIGGFPVLEWGEISRLDFYHAFRTYDPKMRAWIHDLKEGESAFDNADPNLRPHRIVNGKVIENIRKNRDKYTRQKWDRFIQCVHTRNDQLAAQNTIHPEQDRVFSIRELMAMMTIPDDFKWIDLGFDELNQLSEIEKRALYKEHEINIRQCIGEAVPTVIMRQIAQKIKAVENKKNYDPATINQVIEKYDLLREGAMIPFIENNPEGIDVPSLMRITELCNAKRIENAAFYTNKFIVNEIMGRLPDFNQEELRILEPSVGAGGFLPFLFIKYAHIPHVIIDAIDIDYRSIDNLEAILGHITIPQNFTVNLICQDFLLYDAPYKYDLAVGNPPFSKLKKRTAEIRARLRAHANKATNDLAEIFMERCLQISRCVALVLNKSLIGNSEFADTYKLLRTVRIESIIDFGRYGFTGVSIETICMVLYPQMKPQDTTVYNMKFNTISNVRQTYITDERLPYFVIYRDGEFDGVLDKLQLGVFSVFRDRQITKSKTQKQASNSSLWVIKGRNINEDGSGVTHIEGYDAFLEQEEARELAAYKYVGDNEVYLTPNMTYLPRVIENIPGSIPDGSVAVLIPNAKMKLTKEQMDYFASSEYRRFYGIARNLSTQSINVDNCSVYFYGILKDDN